MKSLLHVCLISLFIGGPIAGGVFSGASDSATDPFIVVHPAGYDGTGAVLSLEVCADSPFVASATERAVEIWQALTPTVQNCQGDCRVNEEAEIEGYLDMTSAVLHELGHCAFGLGHPTWENLNMVLTSFTDTQDVGTFDEGPDMIRGSRDDVVSPLPGARLVHWFRIADNNPVVIDSTVIDGSTYSRRITDLPTGSSWPANANRIVANDLGEEGTQAVMYPRIVGTMKYTGLTADEVSMVRLGMTGLDFIAGSGDDYTVDIQFVEDCANADIEVQFFDLGADGPIAGCLKDNAPIPGQGLQDVHFVVIPNQATAQSRIVVLVNSAAPWDVVFADGFESGDLSGWISNFP